MQNLTLFIDTMGSGVLVAHKLFGSAHREIHVKSDPKK